MKCFRCGGFMSFEKFYPPGVQPALWGWRCINCGDIIDEVIISNRWIFGKGRGRSSKRATA
ncbi:MAG: hypothetical protein KG012_19985 [Deltaproteobacteria bacterium]|nr:hypothetical protein [Deltaproteobacteria bacterium]